MVTLVRQEIFKLVHKKSTWATSIILLVIMTIFAVISRNHPNTIDPKTIFVSLFTGFDWIVLFMIAAASSIISMEFQYGTIKELLYRKYY
ncbi:MAG: ABC transporter permease, partial [Lentilactobacillus hilgardii]